MPDARGVRGDTRERKPSGGEEGCPCGGGRGRGDRGRAVLTGWGRDRISRRGKWGEALQLESTTGFLRKAEGDRVLPSGRPFRPGGVLSRVGLADHGEKRKH